MTSSSNLPQNPLVLLWLQLFRFLLFLHEPPHIQYGKPKQMPCAEGPNIKTMGPRYVALTQSPYTIFYGCRQCRRPQEGRIRGTTAHSHGDDVSVTFGRLLGRVRTLLSGMSPGVGKCHIFYMYMYNFQFSPRA